MPIYPFLGVYTKVYFRNKQVIGKLPTLRLNHLYMTKEFTIKGEWFLTEKSEYRVHGTLTYHPTDGINLELYGGLDSDDFFPILKNEEIILGLSSDSKQISLCNCIMTKSGGATLVKGGESGKPSTHYSPRYILIGVHTENVDQLQFDNISSEIFNLGEWIGISGFKNQQINFKKIQNKEVNIQYKLPKSIDFIIDEQTKGSFDFASNYPGFSRYQKNVQIYQKVYFSAKSKTSKNVEDLLKILFSFQNFLVLALYKSTYPISISLSSEAHQNHYPEGSVRKSIKLYFSSSSYQENQEPRSDFEMLFNYHQIKRRFPTIIKNWFAKYEFLEPSFNLVFEQFYRQSSFDENNFLNLAQAAETFHARIHNHTKIPKAKYKIMKEDILKATQKKYHAWLNDQFNFGNNLNLHTRLTEIANKYSNEIVDKILNDKNQFVLDVKNSRNYYTHYSSDGKKKAIKGSELYYLSERLKILLVCSFLIEAGFKKAELGKSLENVKWRLFNHLANWK